MKVDLHFAGFFFSRYPTISYSDGAEQRFEDVDFAGMDLKEFLLFIQRFANEECVNVYFCMPDLQFPDGLRIIAIEKDYQEFIQVGYDSGCVIQVYMDHLGSNVHQWILDDEAEVCSPEDKMSGVGGITRTCIAWDLFRTRLMTCKVMYMMILIPLLLIRP